MRCCTLVLILVSLSIGAPPASAATIDFEDRPAADDPTQPLSEEYADRGVHFSSFDDAATWSGMSNGDPGGWQVDGSNGPTFVGFDGSSYIAVVEFDEPVEGFQLDVARAAGVDWPDDFFMLVAYRNLVIIDVAMVHLGDVNAWQTISMPFELDRLALQGVGFPGYRFAVDNFQWLGDEPDPLIPLEVDIRPGNDANRVSTGSNGMLAVAVYGSAEFDVTELDPSTLVFGPGEATLAHRHGPHLDDVNQDGFPDLLLHFRISSTGIGAEDFEACVSAETWEGVAAQGCDGVTPNS